MLERSGTRAWFCLKTILILILILILISLLLLNLDPGKDLSISESLSGYGEFTWSQILRAACSCLKGRLHIMLYQYINILKYCTAQ